MQEPVVTSTSQATRPVGSSFRTASKTASEIWSAILSGWPSVTDSEVKICRLSDIQLPLTCRIDAAGGHRAGRTLLPPGIWLSRPNLRGTYEETKDLSVTNVSFFLQLWRIETL